MFLPRQKQNLQVSFFFCHSILHHQSVDGKFSPPTSPFNPSKISPLSVTHCYQVPFTAQTLPALANKIVTQEAPPVPSTYSVEARELLSRLLKKDPSDRPRIDQVF